MNTERDAADDLRALVAELKPTPEGGPIVAALDRVADELERLSIQERDQRERLAALESWATKYSEGKNPPFMVT